MEYWRKRGYEVPETLLPPVPKTVTQGSVNRLRKITGDYIKKHSQSPVKTTTTTKATTSTKKPTKESKFHEEYKAVYNKVNSYIAAKAKEGIIIDYTPQPIPDHRSPAKLANLKREYEKIKLRARRAKQKPQENITVIDTSTGEVKQPAREKKPSLFSRIGKKVQSWKEKLIAKQKERYPHKEEPVTPTTSQTILDNLPTETELPETPTIAKEPLAGYDNFVEEVMDNKRAQYQVEQLQEAFKQLGTAYPRRYPAENLPDYAKRLATALRIRGYQDELGEYDERLDRESMDEYLERLANEVSKVTGNTTLSERVNRMRDIIVQSVIEQKGYNPFKPVDDTDRVTPEQLVDFIMENRDEFGVNLPNWANWKKRETLLQKMRELPETTVRNRFMDLQKSLSDLRELKARNAERDKYEAEHPESIATFDDIEDTTDALDSLIDRYGYLPAASVLKTLRNIWQHTLDTTPEKNVRDYLGGVIGELLTSLDEAVSDRLLYHLQHGDVSADDIYIREANDIARMLNMGKPLSFGEALKLG